MKNRKMMTRLLALLMIAVVFIGLAACSGGSSGDAYQITYWIPKGEDTSYYPDYEDNPIIRYIKNNYTFNGKTLDIDFIVAPPGSESDDFSTLIATGEYCGVMDMNMASFTVTELYEEGILWDLTELVPEHMPNYMAFLENHPELAQYLYTYINGEKKILNLRGYRDASEPNFEGFCYRRDWIVKYGTNPSTGAAFTGGYKNPDDYLSWEDDVMFPSWYDEKLKEVALNTDPSWDGTEPVFISDWEWMFEIFVKAMKAEGISDGYCYAPYYIGYHQTGDFASGFGGGAPYWYMKDENTVVNGMTTENTRAFLQCLNTWYNKGWLDKTFDEHTSDMFFAVDAASVYQGKVGLWQGRISTVGNQLETGEDDLTKGIMVFGCKQPINDVYGGEDQKYVAPNCVWQFEQYDGQVILTDKLSEEEVIAFLEWVDFLYTEEGSTLANYGLSKEQYEQCQDAFYTELGLTNGAHIITEQEDGSKMYSFYLDASSPTHVATILNRITCKMGRLADQDKGYDRYLSAAVKAWDYYKNTNALSYLITSSVSVEQNQQITKIESSLSQLQQRTIPQIIKGEGYDIWDDASWQSFCETVNKYRAASITDIYQGVLDSLK
ncbi:MAG: hypothetical protein ACI4PO_02700 [Faecousia sp.]